MKLASLIVVAGLAAAASAQTLTYSWVVEDSADADASIINGSAVLTMWATMDPTPKGFAGSIYDISGDAEWALGSIDAYDNFLDALTDDGTLTGTTITGIESFQLPKAFNGDFDNSNPIALYKLTWTPASYSGQTVKFSDTNHLNNDVYTDDFGTSVGYTPVIEGGSFVVAPAPASMALLGLGGLLAGRRRR